MGDDGDGDRGGVKVALLVFAAFIIMADLGVLGAEIVEVLLDLRMS